MKACPFCAEMIQDDAIKCRHCGKWLDKEEEAKPAGAAADSSKIVIVKIYSYLLMAAGALGILGSIIGFIVLESGAPRPSGAPGFAFLLPILAIYAALIFLALGLLKRKRIAFILNNVVLAIGLITGTLGLVFAMIPTSRVSSGIILIVWSGAWLAYFARNKRLFAN